MDQNLVTTMNRKVAIVGLGTNFHKNYECILFHLRECQLIFVDRGHNSKINIPVLTHEEFLNLGDFSEYQIILSSYKIEEFIKLYQNNIQNIDFKNQ